MASSLKTNHYQLNNWIGTDKPKREDFNGDNGIIDGALYDLNTALVSHTGNAQTHVTQEEKTKWNGKLSLITGVYVGDGERNRAIDLEVAPLVVLLFEDWGAFMTYDFANYSGNVKGGIGSTEGGTSGLTLYENGFSVMDVPENGPSGYTPRLNTLGTTYRYIVFY